MHFLGTRQGLSWHCALRDQFCGPSSAPANGPNTDNHLHANPYPNVAGPGQPKLCEAANETYEKGKLVIGNLPAGSVAKNREITSREENLFGQKYPAQQLKDLGISTAKPKGKKK